MTKLIRNQTFLVLVVIWMLYWPVAYFIPTETLTDYVSGFIAATSVAVAVAYLPGIWRTLREKPYQPRGGHFLLLGTAVVHISIAAIFFWSWSYRVFSRPYWMDGHSLREWFIFVLFTGCVLHLMAGKVNEKNLVPASSWVNVAIAVASGFVLTTILAYVGEVISTQ